MLHESLETRRLMSFTLSLSGEGTLLLKGAAGDDKAVVVQTGPGGVRVEDYSNDPHTPTVRTFAGVRKVLVDMGGGDDALRLTTTDIRAEAYGGSGRDVFEVFNGARGRASSGATVLLRGDAGDDSAFITDYGALGTVFYGGSENDHCKVYEGGKWSLAPTRVYGEGGDDLLEGAGDSSLFIDGNGDSDWDDVGEDLNRNGALDAGEDADGDGALDRGDDYFQAGDAGAGHCRLYGNDGDDHLSGFSEDTHLDGGDDTDTAEIDPWRPSKRTGIQHTRRLPRWV
jgi:hypothetical protein